MPRRSNTNRTASTLKEKLKTESGARDVATKELKKLTNQDMKEKLKTEKGARNVATEELKKVKAKADADKKAIRKASVRATKSKMSGNRPSATEYSTKDGLPTGQKKAPSGGDKLSAAAKKSTQKRTAAKTVQSKATTSVAKKAGSGLLRKVASPVGIALGVKDWMDTGSELKAMQKTKDYGKAGGIDARIRRSDKGVKSEGSVPVPSSLRGKSSGGNKSTQMPKVTTPTVNTSPTKQPTKTQSSGKQSNVATPERRTTPAPVQNGPTRKPVKKMTAYENYQNIMASEGLKDGGVVKGKAMGGWVGNMMKQGAQALYGMAKPKQKNAPKATSDSPPVRVSPKKDGNSGRELVPNSIMEEIQRTRGYEGGGMVAGPRSDMYGSYEGAGGECAHRNIVGSTNLKRG